MSCPTSQPCKTNMRMVCHRLSGRTFLSHVPNGVHGVLGTEVWFKFPKHSSAAASSNGSGKGWTKWMPLGGLPLKAGEVSYRWPGARQAKAFVHIPNGVGEPATEMFILSVSCGR